MTKIYKAYLAGKMTGFYDTDYKHPQNWRSVISMGLGDCMGYMDGQDVCLNRSHEFILKYAGPVFEDTGHGCIEHGRVSNDCIEQIRNSDVIFVWLDAKDAHGTFVEIGYAKALNKPIFMAISPIIYETDYDSEGNIRYYDYKEIAINIEEAIKDLWFPLSMSDKWGRYLDVSDAWKDFISWYKRDILKLIDPVIESPIEKILYPSLKEACGRRQLELKPQFNIGIYRTDFAILGKDTKLAIECDGHAFHEKTKEQATRDRKREREIIAKGYKVLRFTGSEIYKDPASCTREVMRIIDTSKE